MMMAVFAGCGSSDTASAASAATSEAAASTEASSETAAAASDEFIALVTDVGNIDDESFNQTCWEAVVAYGEANGIKTAYYKPTEDSTDARVLSITQAVTEGATVIVMPGYLFGEAIGLTQDKYPDVKFIAVDVGEGDLGDTVLASNSYSMVFHEEQAGYLAGYAAVKEGYTKLGFLGGMGVPAVMRYGYGYIQGINAAAEELGVDVEIKYTYGGQFYGDATITAKMEGWYSEGTEVVFACGGSIYTSAVEAANKYDG
jgi:basic membrane protein A